MSNRRVQTNFRAEDFGTASAKGDEPVSTPAAAPEPEDNETEVPTGTIAEVKDWVGDDKERAQAALDVENAKDNPRSTLVEWLEGVIADEGDE
jgi:hypothetical protein